MNEVMQTTNYSMFKPITANREVKERAVEILVKSIEKKNMLHKRPITISGDLGVIDGQHRLEAARRLGVPIHYTINADMQEEDMPLLNRVQKAWTYTDFLHYYVEKGRGEYIKFDHFMRQNGLRLTQVFSLLSISTHAAYENFREGNFVFPEGESHEKMTRILRDIENVKDLVKKKKLERCPWLENATFVRALFNFITSCDIDPAEFLSKVALKIDSFDQRTGQADYLRMFMQIYNYRRKEPIAVLNGR